MSSLGNIISVAECREATLCCPCRRLFPRGTWEPHLGFNGPGISLILSSVFSCPGNAGQEAGARMEELAHGL